jgi:signal transduction histidine kinase
MTVRYENRLDDLAAVPAGIGRNAYRTIQEALTNARKHAPDAPVDVTVERAAGPGLTVEVRNPLVDGESGIPGSGNGTDRAGRARPACRRPA